MVFLRRHARWLVPTLILGVAAMLRLWRLGDPPTLIFDEIYYVRDAITQLHFGFPTDWPGNSTSPSSLHTFSDTASYAVHPPLGKWWIALGIALFGAENSWGWRMGSAAAGVLAVALTMHLGWLLSRSRVIAAAAGGLLALDGVHIVLSRVGLLDGILTLAVLLGTVCVWYDHRALSSHIARSIRLGRQLQLRHELWWKRPWLLAAGAAFGAAAAVKWSGLYPLAFFLLWITARDVWLRFRLRDSQPRTTSVLQAAITAAISLPAALFTYVLSWWGWIVSSDGWGRTANGFWPSELLAYHTEMFQWHSTLSASHPYASSPWTWPLGLRPTAMYREPVADAQGCLFGAPCVAEVSPIPNILITWGGVAALLLLVWWLVRAVIRASRSASLRPLASPTVVAAGFVLCGFLSGWLPWVLTFSRSAVFQFYAVVLTPFSALALALVLGSVIGIPIRSRISVSRGAPLALASAFLSGEALLRRRIAAAVCVALCVLVSLWMFPLWSGIPVAEWFARLHFWLPGWD